MSRRRLLRTSAVALALTAGGVPAAFARTYGAGHGVPWEPNVADEPYYGTEPGIFFSPAERLTADALTARLIPSDEFGPGARDADVVTFLDRQLAGFYGRAQRWYMAGPFPEPLETQGYQSPHTPRSFGAPGLRR